MSTGTAGSAAPPRRAWRIIPEIDKDPRFIAAAQGIPGRVLLVSWFAIVMYVLGNSLLIVACAAACAYSGRYRWHVVPFATLLLLYEHGLLSDPDLVEQVADQEGFAGRIDLPELTAIMFALVVLLITALLHFWPRIGEMRLFGARPWPWCRVFSV
jgi:hypothetical protein